VTRVTLRGAFAAPAGDGTAVRLLAAALAAAGAEVWGEVQDPGGPASPSAVTPPAPAGVPDLHLQWCPAALVAPSEGRVRVARVTLDVPPCAAATEALRRLDAVWAPDPGGVATLRGLGLDPARLGVCPEPLAVPAPPPWAPAQAPGRYVVVAGDASTDWTAVARGWARGAGGVPGATLVLAAADPALPARVVAALEACGWDPDAVADIVLVGEALTDARRDGLAAGAAAVLRAPGTDGRAAAVAGAHGVPAVDGTDPAAVAAALAGAPAGAAAAGPAAPAARVAAAILDAAALGAGAGAGTPRARAVLSGSMYGVHSLAAVNRGLARALLGSGEVDLALDNRTGARLDPSAPVDDSIRALAWACARRHGPAPVTVRHMHPCDLSPVAEGRLVAVLPWEFGPAPRRWLRALEHDLDEVWVPTPYVRDGFLAGGADPGRVAVVPNGVDPVAFRPGLAPADLGRAAPGYRFLYVGGLAWRKGTDLLLRAYARAFRRDDPVTLVLKDFGPGGPYLRDGVEDMLDDLLRDPSAPRVLRLSGPMPEGALPGLYAACHCLVHPYRGEAYGMTMAEAMACGLPVIAPDRGAARAFMDPGTALLVPSRRVELDVAEMAGEEPAGAPVVHEVDVAALAAAMRAAAADPAAAAAVGARAARHVHAAHTWDAAARVAAARLRALAGAGATAAPAVAA
jgi:glycosyltransferase involved in cell wall biosynthesis